MLRLLPRHRGTTHSTAAESFTCSIDRCIEIAAPGVIFGPGTGRRIPVQPPERELQLLVGPL